MRELKERAGSALKHGPLRRRSLFGVEESSGMRKILIKEKKYRIGKDREKSNSSSIKRRRI